MLYIRNYYNVICQLRLKKKKMKCLVWGLLTVVCTCETTATIQIWNISTTSQRLPVSLSWLNSRQPVICFCFGYFFRWEGSLCHFLSLWTCLHSLQMKSYSADSRTESLPHRRTVLTASMSEAAPSIPERQTLLYSCLYAFVHPHSGCFRCGAPVNEAAVSISGQVIMCT